MRVSGTNRPPRVPLENSTLHLKYDKKKNVIINLKEQKEESDIVQNNIQKTGTGSLEIKPSDVFTGGVYNGK